jgi:hypothetical protein
MTMVLSSAAQSPTLPTILFNNVFEQGIVTVSSETPDGFGANALEDTTFDFWRPASVPAQITVDAGVPVSCDCLGIAAHDLGMSGSIVRVQSSDDNATWTNRLSFSPLTDQTIIGIFALVTARYWRVRIEGFVASIGVIKLGRRVIIPTGVLSGHTAINHSHNVELLTNTSIKGQFLGNRIERIGASASINFGLIETDFVENQLATFERHYNSGRTFFFASSPFKYPKDIGYCWRGGGSGELRPAYEEGGTLMQVNMDVDCYVEQ